MHLIFEIIKGTPTWVLVLFIYLSIIGLKATRRRVTPLYKLFIFPIVLTTWSTYSLLSKFELTPLTTSIWSLSILAGYHIGWKLNRSLSIQADKKRRLIVLPGSLAPLLTFLLIFAIKYYFGFTYAIHPMAKFKLAYYLPHIGLTGLASGLFIGKLLCLIHKYKFTKHTDIIASKRA